MFSGTNMTSPRYIPDLGKGRKLIRDICILTGIQTFTIERMGPARAHGWVLPKLWMTLLIWPEAENSFQLGAKWLLPYFK